MYGRIIVNSLSVILLTMIQVGLVHALPGWLSGLNILILAIIFISVLSNFTYAWWWAVGAGIILDTFSFLPFGIYLISLALTALVIDYLWKSFFTNRSIYSFISLTFFAFIVYKIILYISTTLISLVLTQSFLIEISMKFWERELYALIVNLVFVILIFYLFTFASKSLRPVFLIKARNN
jgi:rod shape-determining protein MreD